MFLYEKQITRGVANRIGPVRVKSKHKPIKTKRKQKKSF